MYLKSVLEESNIYRQPHRTAQSEQVLITVYIAPPPLPQKGMKTSPKCC